ncbi:MAG: hypothetical protein Q4C89_12120 [Deinococcus sp.]|uniref:hypothetical protein n=1 Tax=Deinococcus sp. TaxID=47478 RepID=UPI0026DC4E54|nr:hypothetical protein [Deinococcus sp.]MDO4246761.1 hypothetical protein [Deinococcus sp.]
MKKILMGAGLTLLLASCGGSDKTPPAAAVTSVSGTVVEAVTSSDEFNLKTTPWTGGKGQVVAKNVKDGSELARGTLNADGSFSLALPTSVSSLQDPNFEDWTGDSEGITGIKLTCTGTPSVSNKEARGTSAVLSAEANKKGAIHPTLFSGTDTDTSIQMTVKAGGLMYVDRDVQMTGTQTCTGSEGGVTETITVKLEANLKAGWNLITAAYSQAVVKTGDRSGTVTTNLTLTSGGLPTDQWVLGDSVAMPLGFKSTFGPLR